MKISALLAILIFAVGVASLAVEQEAPSAPPKQPQLTLEVIPSKKIYRVGETVSVRYRLTSIVDGTLCLPRPAAEANDAYASSLRTEMRGPDGAEFERFIEHFWPVSPTDDGLRDEIQNKWVKLGMSEPSSPRRPTKVAVLSELGEWVLRSTYEPPKLTANQKAIVESFGCSVPDVRVQSEPVTITVTAQ